MLVREGSEEEAAGEGERLHAETAGNGGIQTYSVIADFLIFIIADMTIRVVDGHADFIIPEVETDTCRHVDERFQGFASVEIVTVVEKDGHFLKRGGVQTVAKTYTENIVLLESDAVHEHARPTHILPDEKAIFIDEVVGDLLVLLLLCGKRTQAAESSDA